MPTPAPPPERTRIAADAQRGLALEKLLVMAESLAHSADVRREVLTALGVEWNARAALLWTFEAARNPGAVPTSQRPQGQIELGLGVQNLKIEPEKEQDILEQCGRAMVQAMAAARPVLAYRDAVPHLPAGLAVLNVPFSLGRLPLAVAQMFVDEEAARSQGDEWVEQLSPLVRAPRPLVQAPAPVAPVARESGNVSVSVPPQTTQQAPTKPALPVEGELDRFVLELHRTLRLDHMALTAVNDGRMILGADRMALAARRGGRQRILAISGTEKVNQRSDEVRFLRQLIRRVCATSAPLTYTGEMSEIPPPIERDLASYVDSGRARMVRLLPLLEPERGVKATLADAEHADRRGGKRKVIGCLVMESFSDSQLAPATAEKMDLMGRHVATALRNSLQVQSVPFMGVWRLLGTMRESLHGKTLTKLLLGIAAAVAVLVGLAFIPFPYRLTADGRLLPAQRQQVFAPWDGHIVEIPVSSGQRVAAGQVLARLENEELRQQVVTVNNDLQSQQQSELALQSEIDVARRLGEMEQVGRLRGEQQEARVKITGLQQQLEILKLRYENLVVTAPTDGVVATFQVDQLLRDRPVTRGDVLLEVMRDDGPWELEVEIPDHRMGHLLKQLQASDERTVPVEFILQTDTATTFSGDLTVQGLANRSGLSRDGAAVVPARIALRDDPRLQRRIGAEVTAKIDCGMMNLGYVLFGDVLEFLQRFLWL